MDHKVFKKVFVVLLFKNREKSLENKMCSLKCILSWKVKGNDVLVYKKVWKSAC